MSESTMPPDVRLVDVVKEFAEVRAVDGISLEIPRGSFFALLGPSGCGKTTTLRMIGGFEEPSEGRIFLGDRDVVGLPPYKRDVNTVFQSYALFPHMTVTQNVAFGLERRKIGKTEVRARVREVLELVDLAGRGERKPRQLSGGQQQRVALARAIVNNPRVLLLDEPLGALDLKLRKQMQIELKQIQREVGITFVYVTHDQEEALSMSDRIAVMESGIVKQCGEPEDVYERPGGEFVAGFIGISNLIEGTVADSDRVRIRSGEVLPAPLPDDCETGATVHLSVRPEKIAVDEDIDEQMVSLTGRVVGRVYLGVSTQVTVALGDGAHIVALEQATYRARADDRWEEGMEIRVGWHPDNCLVLR